MRARRLLLLTCCLHAVAHCSLQQLQQVSHMVAVPGVGHVPPHPGVQEEEVQSAQAGSYCHTVIVLPCFGILNRLLRWSSLLQLLLLRHRPVVLLLLLQRQR
jgi:hypothetical protein